MLRITDHAIGVTRRTERKPCWAWVPYVWPTRAFYFISNTDTKPIVKNLTKIHPAFSSQRSMSSLPCQNSEKSTWFALSSVSLINKPACSVKIFRFLVRFCMFTFLSFRSFFLLITSCLPSMNRPLLFITIPRLEIADRSNMLKVRVIHRFYVVEPLHCSWALGKRLKVCT